MTEERKRYLAGIGREEQLVRNQIRYYHREIVGSKYDLKFYKSKGVPWLLNEKRENIRKYKVIVKLLKKQLPAPARFVREGKWGYNSCSVCKDAVNEDELYCHSCGQKLR